MQTTTVEPSSRALAEAVVEEEDEEEDDSADRIVDWACLKPLFDSGAKASVCGSILQVAVKARARIPLDFMVIDSCRSVVLVATVRMMVSGRLWKRCFDAVVFHCYCSFQLLKNDGNGTRSMDGGVFVV